MIYYYFLKSTLDDTVLSNPINSNDYLGDIGDFIEVNGVGYIILDYVEEIVG